MKIALTFSFTIGDGVSVSLFIYIRPRDSHIGERGPEKSRKVCFMSSVGGGRGEEILVDMEMMCLSILDMVVMEVESGIEVQLSSMLVILIQTGWVYPFN